MRVSNEDVESIAIDPGPSEFGIRKRGRATGPTSARVVFDAMTFLPWYGLAKFATGIEERIGMSFDEVGFRYPVEEELNPGEAPFEGVNAWDPLDNVYLSQSAFERAWLRFLTALVQSAEREHDRVEKESFWPEFVARVQRLQARLAGEEP
jgi:hypothetical protein